MIQVENQIFTAIRAKVLGLHSGAYVTGEYTPTPNKFPCVFVQEIDNYGELYDLSGKEQVTSVAYEIDVYSAKTSGKKKECKEIISEIDEVMEGLGLTRTMCQPTPNEDTTVFRMTSRYSGSIYNNTVYRR